MLSDLWKKIEAKRGASQFSEEALHELKQLNAKVYPSTGLAIRSFREAGTLWSDWHKGYDFENLPSIMGEVAIFPNNLYLPNCSGLTLEQQIKLLEEFNKKLVNKVPNVQAILGDAPTWVEVILRHFDSTGARLTGAKDGYRYIRTTTPTAGSDVALVGSFRADGGLFVSSWDRDDGGGGVWAAPLVVPTRK